ncbi:hypothetical protein D9M68_540300 [compost metagenome]
MAHYLGLHRYSVNDWERLKQAVSQSSLFADPVPAAEQASESSAQVESPAPAPAAVPTHTTGRRFSRSGYLKRR